MLLAGATRQHGLTGSERGLTRVGRWSIEMTVHRFPTPLVSTSTVGSGKVVLMS